jgi:hypothetical protein
VVPGHSGIRYTIEQQHEPVGPARTPPRLPANPTLRYARSGHPASSVCALGQKGGVTVSTGSLAARRHAGVWAPIIACKTKVANDNLALAA